LIMEHLDHDLMHWASGSSGKARKGSGPSLSEIARVGVQILDGVEWLHKKGWLFVDFKPDNFMFRGDDIVFIDCKRCITGMCTAFELFDFVYICGCRWPVRVLHQCWYVWSSSACQWWRAYSGHTHVRERQRCDDRRKG
jgi:hypothetical protein